MKCRSLRWGREIEHLNGLYDKGGFSVSNDVRICETKLVFGFLTITDHYKFITAVLIPFDLLVPQCWFCRIWTKIRDGHPTGGPKNRCQFGWTVWSPILALVIMVGSYYFHPCECGRLAKAMRKNWPERSVNLKMCEHLTDSYWC